MFTPPSPWTTSSRTAAQEGSIAASKAPKSLNGTCLKPSGKGWNVSCFSGWPVAWSVARVLPWKRSQRADDYMLTPTAIFASKLDCSFKRFRSAVAKKDLATSALKSVNRLCDFQTWHGFVQVRDVKKSSCLFGESLSYRWM
tara:strand:- start:732 stop:1157 length:426 start_codon:yes stop_codon:yes gene_type:complete